MIFYDIVFIIFSLFYIPFSLYKKGFRRFNLKSRLGFVPEAVRNKLRSSKNIWIHAVSVGEVMVLGALIDSIKKSMPDHSIVISTTTNTGNEIARKNFESKAIVIYSPLDLSFSVKRFFRIIKPQVLVIVETEIWPNLIGKAQKENTPVVIINGRISPRSFKKYKLARPFLRHTLKKISLFCMQSKDDQERMLAIGAQREKIKVTGNMKFDINIATSLSLQAARENLGLAEKDLLIVAGSTHRGEEKILVDAYKNLQGEFKNLKLLIAPRHLNRAPEIRKLVKNTPGIFLLDTIGQLRNFYSIADIVFIGGSLISHGGQNPIEPAYFSKPIIFGPYMFNFKEIAGILLKETAAIEVKDRLGLQAAISLLIKDPKKAKAMGFFAKKAIEINKGASNKNFEVIKSFLPGAKAGG